MITGVALRFGDQIFCLPKPNRHHHLIHKVVVEHGLSCSDCEQGFVTIEGEFLDRVSAAFHALKSGQISEFSGRPYSEDLW